MQRVPFPRTLWETYQVHMAHVRNARAEYFRVPRWRWYKREIALIEWNKALFLAIQAGAALWEYSMEFEEDEE